MLINYEKKLYLKYRHEYLAIIYKAKTEQKEHGPNQKDWKQQNQEQTKHSARLEANQAANWARHPFE